MRGRSWFAALAVLTLIPAAAGAGTLEGRVVDSTGQTPVPEAIVHVFHLSDGTLFSSGPTGPDGAYRIESLPAGPYDVAVETLRGLWLGEAIVTLPDKESTARTFSLRERAYWEGLERMPARETAIPGNIIGMAMTMPSEDQAAAWSTKKKALVWGLIGGGAALLLLSSGNGGDDEPPASPSMP